MSEPKTYAIPIVVSVLFVLLSPLGLFAILLSADSCCGENTTATMFGVAVAIVVLLALVAALLSGAVKLTVKRHTPDFTIRTATLITAGPGCARPHRLRRDRLSDGVLTLADPARGICTKPHDRSISGTFRRQRGAAR